MTLEEIFSLAGATAMLGWLVLLASPLWPVWTQRISGLILPLILSLGYSALILVYWAGSEGGYGSLAEVMQLFTRPELVLAGWIHYLAFDLFIGAWECRTARAEGIRFWLVIPCLALTFLFGPVGLLLFMALRAVKRVQAAGAAVPT